MREVAVGAGAEASAIAGQTAAAVEVVRLRFQGQGSSSDKATPSAEGGPKGAAGRKDHDEIMEGGEGARTFFTERLKAKQMDAGISGVDLSDEAASAAAAADGEGAAGSPSSGPLLTPMERAETEDRLRRIHATAVLASAAVDAAAPIVSSSQLRVSAVIGYGIISPETSYGSLHLLIYPSRTVLHPWTCARLRSVPLKPQHSPLRRTHSSSKRPDQLRQGL